MPIACSVWVPSVRKSPPTAPMVALYPMIPLSPSAGWEMLLIAPMLSGLSPTTATRDNPATLNASQLQIPEREAPPPPVGDSTALKTILLAVFSNGAEKERNTPAPLA